MSKRQRRAQRQIAPRNLRELIAYLHEHSDCLVRRNGGEMHLWTFQGYGDGCLYFLPFDERLQSIEIFAYEGELREVVMWFDAHRFGVSIDGDVTEMWYVE
jgi:hypothetical protein